MDNERGSGLPAGLPKPALRALSGAGYVRLGRLTTISPADVSRLHGVGPKAVDRLRRALDAKGQSFAGGEWA